MVNTKASAHCRVLNKGRDVGYVISEVNNVLSVVFPPTELIYVALDEVRNGDYARQCCITTNPTHLNKFLVWEGKILHLLKVGSITYFRGDLDLCTNSSAVLCDNQQAVEAAGIPHDVSVSFCLW